MKKRIMLGVLLNQKMYDEFKEMSEKTRITMSRLVRDWIQEGINEYAKKENE